MPSLTADNREQLRAGMWLCPVCRAPMKSGQRQWICGQGHSFDKARQGYVNLLPAQHRRSASPGDDKQMIDSRREFLERGYYRPLAERLRGLCSETMTASRDAFALLDTGCGEGYYTCLIADALRAASHEQGLWIGGIDISRPAVAMAAKRCPAVEFAVASNACIPLADTSIDCLTRIFAPGYPEEAVRVLRPAGVLIAVTPGPRHLFELRSLVYEQPREHALKVECPEGLRHLERVTLEFALRVEREDIARLLRMTPYFWKASRSRQSEIAGMPVLETEAAFLIDIFRREARAGRAQDGF